MSLSWGQYLSITAGTFRDFVATGSRFVVEHMTITTPRRVSVPTLIRLCATPATSEVTPYQRSSTTNRS
jgi:hypothetical protein